MKINNDSFDYRLSLINNKVNELNISINSIKNQKKTITINLKRSVSLEEREIYFNNLHLLDSMLNNYEKQKIFLKKKKEEYYLIIYSKSKEEKIRLLDIWKNQIESFFRISNLFDYKFYNQDFLIDFENDNNKDVNINVKKLIKS